MSIKEKSAGMVPVDRAREIDRQLPKAPWKVGEVSCSQADIVDCYGGWICTIRKDFDAEDPEDHPLIVELRNMLPELLAAFAQAREDLARSIAVTDEKITDGEQWRDKWRKVVAEQTADRIEIERLHNALEAAEKKLSDLREVDAATCRDVIRCADKCARLRGELEHVRGELVVAGKMIVKVREEANQQRARAEACEASMAKRWHKGPPTSGRWRLSIRPELRRGFPAVVECEVLRDSSGYVVQYRAGGDLLPLYQDWFAGALWQRIEESADPFNADKT